MRRYRDRFRVAAEQPDARRTEPALTRAAGWSPRRGPAAALRAAVRARPRVAWRLLAFLLVVPLVIGVAAPARVSGDELANARAQQKALQQKIADQKAEVARLQALQSGLASDMASTTRALGGVNANLAQTKQQIAGLTTKLTAVRVVYADLVQQVNLLDREVVSLGAGAGGQGPGARGSKVDAGGPRSRGLRDGPDAAHPAVAGGRLDRRRARRTSARTSISVARTRRSRRRSCRTSRPSTP